MVNIRYYKIIFLDLRKRRERSERRRNGSTQFTKNLRNILRTVRPRRSARPGWRPAPSMRAIGMCSCKYGLNKRYILEIAATPLEVSWDGRVVLVTFPQIAINLPSTMRSYTVKKEYIGSADKQRSFNFNILTEKQQDVCVYRRMSLTAAPIWLFFTV